MDNILIRANKRAALRYYFPIIAVLILFVIFAAVFKTIDSQTCTRIAGINSAFIFLIFFVYVIPLTILIGSLWLSFYGFKILKYKYYPPISIPVFKDTEATVSKRSKIKGIFYLLSPFYCVWIVYLGYTSYTDLMNGKTVTEYIITIEADCNKISELSDL